MSGDGNAPREAPKKNGRPRKELPGDGATIANAYDQLETMAGLGLSEEKMALILNVSADTLTRRMNEDPELLRRLKRGRATAEANVAEARYNEAIGVKDIDEQTKLVRRYPSGQPVYLVRPNMTAVIWCDKILFGHRERVAVEDETPERPGQLPQVPLPTLRAAVAAAELAQKSGRVLPFSKRKEA